MTESDKNIKFIFCTLAPVEMSFCLRILANPSEYPECSAWAKKQFDSLSSNLKQEILFFNAHYQWYFITDTLIYLIAEDEVCSDDISVLLKRFQDCDDLTFSYIFLGFSITDFDQNTLKSWIENPAKIDLTKAPKLTQYIAEEDILYYFEHLDEIRTRIIALYRQFWIECFHKQWKKIRSYEADAISHQRIRYQHDTPLHYLTTLHPDLVVEDGLLKFQKDDPFEIPISEIKTIVIKPSVFVGTVLSGNIVNDKVTITLNLNFHTVMTADPASAQLYHLLNILSDPSRLKILKVLWNYDATTKELAEILSLSPTTVSLHLKQLKEGGFVTTQKVRKYVYYQLRKDKFYGIEQRLLRYLNY